MIIGPVLHAAPRVLLIRKSTDSFDWIILLQGRTWRVGCDRPIGSSKVQTNAPEKTCGV